MFASLLILASGSTVLGTDIMAQVRANRVLCSNPDESTKTCSTIASYTRAENGVFTETAELLISPNQPITLEMSSTVKVDGAVNCGALTLPEMQKGRLRLNGTLLSADRNEAALRGILEKLAPMAGQKTCEVLRIEAGQLFKYGQVERIDIKLPGKPVKWVALDEGFRVAPRKLPDATAQ
jgi:hypothetical protein